MDLVLLDARVLTIDRANRVADAIAVWDGRIAAVGSNSEIESLARAETPIVRLGGRTVIPGFIDPHTHFSITMLEPVAVDCGTPPHPSIQSVLQAIRAAAAAAPAGRWIRGWGFRVREIREGRAPTRQELDEVAPDHPVGILDGSVHCAFVNSAALRLAGIDRDTPDPAHGRILREADGEANGTLWETAADGVNKLSLRDNVAALGDGLADLIEATGRRHLALGLTSVADALVGPEAAAAYKVADRRAALPLALHQMLGGDGFFDPPTWVEEGTTPEVGDSDRLRGGTVKLFMDPVYPSPARIRYHTDGREERFGARYYTQEEANDIVLAAHRRGYQVAIHCMGTWSIEQALTAIEHALRAAPANDPRFRIEHFTTPTLGLIRRAKALGVVPVVQPPYLLARPAGGNLAADLGGDVRLHPYRTMLDEGVTVAGSSDYPCAPLDPLLGVFALVTRRSRSGEPMMPEEAVSPIEALRMYTLNGAIAMRRELEVGSIEPGKRADLAVLSADPTTVAPDTIKDIVVEQTYVDGRLAYDRSSLEGPAAARG